MKKKNFSVKNIFKNKKVLFLIIGLLIGMLIWGIILPYAKVERLTRKYGDQFTDLHKQSGLIQEIEYLKVFYYDHTTAHVYYVEEGHSSRNYFVFYKENQTWELLYWKCLWSYSGSADDNIWPFYP